MFSIKLIKGNIEYALKLRLSLLNCPYFNYITKENLRGTDKHSGEVTVSKWFFLPSENESTLKGKKKKKTTFECSPFRRDLLYRVINTVRLANQNGKDNRLSALPLRSISD